jgi:hypothetical protein
MNVRAETVALCVAMSSLFACGRSDLHSSAGAAGATPSGGSSTGSPGVAGIEGNIGTAGVPGVAGTAGSAAAIDGGISGADASSDGAVDGAGLPFRYATVAGCSKDGWCWSTPTPQGDLLSSVNGSSASDVWAVGAGGAIIHWDGQSWRQIPSGIQTGFDSVWSASASDAWAVGDDAAVLHWDGSTWSPAAGVPTPPAGCFPGDAVWRSVWGSGPSDVWIVGDCLAGAAAQGQTIHWDGSRWTPFTLSEGLSGVWGTGPDDAWAVGSAHVDLFHWDGQSWTMVATGPPAGPGTAIWGASSSDLWIGYDGGDNDIPPSHWNGMAVASNAATSGIIHSGRVVDLWGSSSEDVWAVGCESIVDPYWVDGLILHWNGIAWDEMPSTSGGILYGVWGSRSDDVWAVGDWGAIVHWDGRAWSAPAAPAAPAGPPYLLLYTVWGGGPEDVWAFGDDEMGLGALHWNGQTWARTELLDAAALGASPSQWATCPGGECEDPGTIPRAVWGSGSDDIWVGASTANDDIRAGGGPSFFVHWDGHAWSLDSTLDAGIAASMRLAAMWGNGPKDVWAVGEVAVDPQTEEAGDQLGVAVHWDGARWSAVTSLSSTDLAQPFRSVWSSGPDDVWIGAATAVLHWDGQTWSQSISGPNDSIYVISGSSSSDVWAVTTDGFDMSSASHWNGTSWQQFTVPSVGAGSLIAISPTNAWLHDGLSVAHWDGTSWTPSESGASQFPETSNFYWDGTYVSTIANDGVIHHP